MQQTYVNTINELNEQLRLFKQQNDQLETEKYILNQQLENQSSISFSQERNTPTPGKQSISRNQIIYENHCIDSISSDSKLIKKQTHPAQIHEVCTTSSFLYSRNFRLL
jgi:hypothetical protein